MFTGIIEAQGSIKTIERSAKKMVITIKASARWLRGVTTGESIAVDGTCLTVVARAGDWFRVEVMPITVKCTRMADYKKFVSVNLERAMRLSDRLGGHMVLGHVDGTARVSKVVNQGESKMLTIKTPSTLAKYLAARGSIAINGVSLTIAERTNTSCAISLVRLTQIKTNLGTARKGDTVNIEVDVLARYLDQILNSNSLGMTT